MSSETSNYNIYSFVCKCQDFELNAPYGYMSIYQNKKKQLKINFMIK